MIQVLITAGIVLAILMIICVVWIMVKCFQGIRDSQKRSKEFEKSFEDFEERRAPAPKRGGGRNDHSK